MKMKNFLYLLALSLPFPGFAESQTLPAGIRQHRMGTLTIKAHPGAKVTVRQLRHEFWFGTAISRHIFNESRGTPEDRERYLTVLKENFNSAVHENALKWSTTERTQGDLSYESADRMLSWCEKNGLTMRGHCVFWCVDKYVQPWIKHLDDATLRTRVENRANDLLSRYRGRIPEYDVNNEMLHAGFYRNRLGEAVRHDMFQWCHRTDPEAILYVNDYDILSGGDLEEYEKQIAGFLEAGVPVGGIGLQGHFNAGGVDTAHVQRVLDRLAKFGLPIKITEFDINTRNEEAKRKGLVDLYSTAFSHPSVNGILMWGFWEGAHWRPKAALWRKDWSPTPAAKAYRDLVYRQWWTDTSVRANADGVSETVVFFGDHEVKVEGNPTRIVTVSREEGSQSVDLTGAIKQAR